METKLHGLSEAEGVSDQAVWRGEIAFSALMHSPQGI
jgi:hypothetical protein